MSLSTMHIVLIVIGIILLIWLVSYWFSKNNTNKQSDTVPLSGNNILSSHGLSETMSNVEASEESPYTLYYFYDPNCPHCQQFESTWENVAGHVRNTSTSTKALNVTDPKNENIVFYYNITHLPTIILVTPDKSIEYKGNRTFEDLLNFARQNINQD